MNEVSTITPRDNGALVESVIVKGDLSKLTSVERTQYYTEVCRSIGLNPLTKPLEYITLNGKLVLYARKDCTDQLRALHKVSVVDLSETDRDGVYIVTAKVQNAEGRTDMAKGAVPLGNLKGDALANAIMKAETKAKRRATLSICGLGFLDESELDTVSAAPAEPVERRGPPPAPKAMTQADKDLLEAARVAAHQGRDALSSFWKGLAKPQRAIVNTIMDDLEKITKAVAERPTSPSTGGEETNGTGDIPHDPETGEIVDEPALLEPGMSRQLTGALMKRLHDCKTTADVERWAQKARMDMLSLQPADRSEVRDEWDAMAAELFDREQNAEAE